jgi:hypothetical protein
MNDIEKKRNQKQGTKRDIALFNNDVDCWDHLISMVHNWHMGKKTAWNDTDMGKEYLKKSLS